MVDFFFVDFWCMPRVFQVSDTVGVPQGLAGQSFRVPPAALPTNGGAKIWFLRLLGVKPRFSFDKLY